MFFFGDAADSAEICIENALRLSPRDKLPDKSPEEMDPSELKDYVVILYMATKSAMREELDSSVIDSLVSLYDHAFTVLAIRSKDFREHVASKLHRPLGGQHNKGKYMQIVNDVEAD